jgi:DMSO/TMAO reductase YedYZ molybdopterin-dependent catalytic subunit
MNNRHPEIILPEPEIQRELGRRTRRGFLIGGIAATAGIGAYEWMQSVEEEDGTPKLERRLMDANGRLAHAYLSDSRLMPSYSPTDVRELKPNGNFGLEKPLSRGWQLTVKTRLGPALRLSLADIQALPRVEMITNFCCIEGWNTIVRWAGARFSDFAKKYFPPGENLPPYVSMNTPDEEYYVGLDAKSAMHPQTLLAYEYGGQPLTREHGAPLRLVIPVKYGIKNIKRIGAIEFTDKKPGDYWAEQGYDWFAGL